MQDIEISHILGCKVEEIRKYRQLIRPEMRLDEPLRDEESSTRGEMISDPEDAFEETDSRIDNNIIKGVVNELSADMRRVIMLRFWHCMTYDRIAEHMKISKQE